MQGSSIQEMILLNLKQKVENYSPPPALGITQSRILMIGPKGAGKASFAKTINYIFQERIAQQSNANFGVFNRSVTYRQHQVRNLESHPLNFCLCDTCGIGEDGCPDEAELNYVLEGNVEEGYQFNARVPITSRSKGFISEPGLHKKIHCVVFVFEASKIKTTEDKIWEKCNQLQKRIDALDIPSLILLTKIDKISKESAYDVAKFISSMDFKGIADCVANKLCASTENVLPVQNYGDTATTLDVNINIRALHALVRILDITNTFLIRRHNSNDNGPFTCNIL